MFTLFLFSLLSLEGKEFMSINTVLSTPSPTAPKGVNCTCFFKRVQHMTPLGFLCFVKRIPMKTSVILILVCVALGFAIKAIKNPTTSSLDDRKNAIERAVANM